MVIRSSTLIQDPPLDIVYKHNRGGKKALTFGEAARVVASLTVAITNASHDQGLILAPERYAYISCRSDHTGLIRGGRNMIVVAKIVPSMPS